MGFCSLRPKFKPYVYIKDCFYRCKTCRLGHCSLEQCLDHIAEAHPGVLPEGFKYGIKRKSVENV